MQIYRCQPTRGPVDGVITLSGSKSIINRALISAALADGTSKLSNVLFAEDTLLMMEALRCLGVSVAADQRQGTAELLGCCGHLPAQVSRLACGNSGTTIRFCTALCSLGHGRHELDGTPRMRQRPIGALVDALQTLGCPVEYGGAEGYPPLVVHGRGLRGGTVTFQSPASSQFLSALLLVAPYAVGDVLIEARGDQSSRPYVGMTLGVMERFGVPVLSSAGGLAAKSDDFADRFIVEAPQRFSAADFAIEPDASSASYFLAAAALTGGRVTIEGLGSQSIQGDVGFVKLLERMGCRAVVEPARIVLQGPASSTKLAGLDVDLADMPDMVPTLAVLALFADGATCIRNVGNLRVKESDRLAALARELSKLGAAVEESADGLRITPPSRVLPGIIETYADHRIAMSFALVGLRVPDLAITDPGCVGKTLPDFFQRLECLVATAS